MRSNVDQRLRVLNHRLSLIPEPWGAICPRCGYHMELEPGRWRCPNTVCGYEYRRVMWR